MTEHDKFFPFRGKINEHGNGNIGKSFYMVGKFTDEGAEGAIASETFTNNTTITTKEDLKEQTFILCSNQYLNGNGYNQRLYFSADPHDYQIDKSNNSLNQGAANLTYTQDEGIINLKYTTYFDSRNKFRQGDWKEVPEILNQIPLSDQVKSQNFIFNNDTYNLDNTSLYYSVPYEIKKIPGNNTSTENVNFTFRGISHPSTLGTSTYFPRESFREDRFHCSNVEKIKVWESGTSVFIVPNPNYSDRYTISVPISELDPDTTTGLCILTDYHFTKNNVLKLENNNDSEYVYCNFLGTSGTSAVFNIDQRALYDGLSIPSTGASGITSIHSELRNTRVNFSEINGDFLRYYLIPYEAYGYFTKGYTLEHIAETKSVAHDNLHYFNVNNTVGAHNNVIYDPIIAGSSKNSDLTDIPNLDLEAYQKFYNYFVFHTCLFLNSKWLHRSNSKNSLGINDSTLKEITNFTWATTNEAYQGFMYDYCTRNPYQTCGNCYGLNEFHQDLCHVTSETRSILTGVTKSLQGTPPLNSSQENHGKSSGSGVPRILYFWWFFAMILILICYMFYIVYKIFTIKNQDEKNRDIEMK